MSEKKNEVIEQKQPTFSAILTDGLNETKDALPVDFNIARFVQNSVALLNGNEVLMKYAKSYGTAPIRAGLMRGAYLGLDALNGEFHLVPYGDKLNFALDYRGATKLMKKYSTKEIDDIFAEVIRQGDTYSREMSNGKWKVDHIPKPFNEGAIIGAYAMCVYKDGTVLVEELSLKELEKIRSKSKMANGMAWKDFTTEMYKKTCLHRLKKRITLDFDTPTQKEIFDDDGAINMEQGRCQEEYHDFDEEPQAEEVIVENTVIDEEVDLPDFMKG